MRRVRLLLLVLLVAVATGIYYGSHNGSQLPWLPGTGEPGAPSSGEQQTKAQGTVRPTFDVVRAEPTGDLVMAGRAEPGWTTTVESNGKVVGTAVADANGEWVIQPTTPIAAGEHSLQLKAQAPKGGQTLFSKQRLALSVGDPGKGQPLVALTEEGQATRVLQMSPPLLDDKKLSAVGSSATATLEKPPFKPSSKPIEDVPAEVSFSAIDYDQASGRSTLFLSGRGTPGARLMLYADNEFLGTATIDATGSWALKAVRELVPGSHQIRADSVEIADGKVLARAEVSFDRQVPNTVTAANPAPAQKQVALASNNEQNVPQDRPTARAVQPQAEAAADVATATPEGDNTGPVKLAGTDAQASEGDDEDAGVIIVRRGDTLWQIAERRYGSGAKYTQIFRSNRGQIRNPDLIYPAQRFAMPR